MSDEHRIARGRQATLELRETEAAFEAVEAALLKELGQTPIGQEAKVLNLHKTLHNLAALRQALLAVVNDGMLAQHAIAVAGLTRLTA